MRAVNRSRSAANRIVDFVGACAMAAAHLSLLTATVILLYAVKSKLGINLLPGPSPLHGVFLTMREFGLV